MSSRHETSLLLYVPVAMHVHGGEFWFESQAVNGLDQWSQHFGRITLVCLEGTGEPPTGWAPISAVPGLAERLTIERLPQAWMPLAFMRARPAVEARLEHLISDVDYLVLAIGGLIGDWGAVACDVAHRLDRDYAVWADRVESNVVRNEIASGPFKRRLRAALTFAPMRRQEERVIGNAALGLFHGDDVHGTYAPHAVRSEVVHNIHIKPHQHITQDALTAKHRRTLDPSSPLKIAYAGRADAMKGPLDWIETLGLLDRRGVSFDAVWLGDGEEMGAMREAVAAHGLEDRVALPGHAAGHDLVLETLRGADLFMFCHKTKESPRCLIEALVSGAPIVGYGGDYARGLIRTYGGGRLVPLGDTAALAEAVSDLAADRGRLADLQARAARDGAPFSDEAVFAHRAQIIQEVLPGALPN